MFTRPARWSSPGRLRFDFHHNQPVTHDELTRVERIVNDQIRADYPVMTREMDYQSALSEGAMALFGEKYGVCSAPWYASPASRAKSCAAAPT